MEIIINELSLDGQFHDANDFVTRGLLPYLAFHKSARSNNTAILKRDDMFTRSVTADSSLHDILVSTKDYQLRAALSKLKLAFSLMSEPFWNLNSQQNSKDNYLYRNECVNGTALAEAEARRCWLYSMAHDDFMGNDVMLTKKGNEVSIVNIMSKSCYITQMYKVGQLSYGDYIAHRFSGTKLDFSEISPDNGFNLIRKEFENVFTDSFRIFSETEWADIPKVDSLDYKHYNNNKKTRRFFSEHYWEKGIWKFRVTQEDRCLGYVENNIFHVLRFDIGHILSDLG